MKRIVYIVALLSLSLFADRVELYDGRIIQSDSIWMKGDKIFVEDMVFGREEVKSIIFSEIGLEALEREIPHDIRKILEVREELIATYSDFPGVVLLDKGVNRLNPDGTHTYRYHFRGLILKDSKRIWASFQRRFIPDMEKLTIEMAQVIKPDGRVIPLDMSTVKITKSQRGKVFFDKGKTISFTLPNVEVGDIVEYVFTEDIFNPWDKNIFTVNWLFGGTEPVVFSNIDIIII